MYANQTGILSLPSDHHIWGIYIFSILIKDNSLSKSLCIQVLLQVKVKRSALSGDDIYWRMFRIQSYSPKPDEHSFKC